MSLPRSLKDKLDEGATIDDLSREEQLALVADEGAERVRSFGVSVDESLEQLRDEGISAGFADRDVRFSMERMLRAGDG